MFLRTRYTFSGTVDGESLRLISDNSQMTLLKSDLDAFAQEKSKLAAIGSAIATANEEAKYQAEARGFFDSLISEGKSIEGNLAKLPKAETDADNFIAKTRQRRDAIVNRIKALRTKLQFVSLNDVGEIKSIIGGLSSELGGIGSEYGASIHFSVIEYDKLQTDLKNFKSHCDQWSAKYRSTLPLQCKSFQTYLMNYQSSRGKMKQKYDAAGNMFILN